MSDPHDIHGRKDAHLEIAASGRGAFRRTTTLLEEVALVHQALPELGLDEIDLSVEWLGRRLAAPILIGAMTGGTETAARTNRELAEVAESLGVGFCLGSQRVMAEDPASAATFSVRDVAPGVALLGNIGAVQARDLGLEAVARLVEAVGADGIAIHLNPAQELVQSGGDRDFRGLASFLRVLARGLDVPVVVKETGCGISRQAGSLIAEAEIEWVEVAGAGGTSWVRVEAEREPERRHIGELFGEWGIPTAASLLLLEGLPLRLVAGGGLRSALDVAKCLALGARLCAVAQPILVAYREGGQTRAAEVLRELIEGLRMICLLAGARTAHDLAHAPRVLGPRLKAWAEQGREEPLR
ncbi:MAG: type 2 isopentenyl-diphosphate Delta-isomerase [Deltaproteobacteria bacterium]|nr:MAG: type 2 isopentenyl-diphosphate Delta-isomerase [Deltaproteobacteria bacterium]